MSEFKPTQLPPTQTGNGSDTTPRDLSAAEIAMMFGMTAQVETAPTLSPPVSVSQISMDWQNNKKFIGSWSIDQDRNVWYYVEGIGWKKLTHQSESGIVGLNIVAAHAKQTQSVVNYRDEADGMIYEMYVW